MNGRARIRLRLTAWYAATLALVLAASALSLRFAVHQALHAAQEEAQRASVELFRQFFRVELAEYRSIEATLAHIATELVFDAHIVDVHRPDGALFTVAGQPSTHPARALPPPVAVLSAPLDTELAPGWTVEVHSSTATMADAARRIDRGLLLGTPLVVAFAGVLGWWLAGRALRPIGMMAAAATRLDAHSGGRLPINDPTDELGRLGTAFNALLARLEAAVAQQRRFLADAAHELRMPLARLRSRAELGLLGATAGAKRDDEMSEALRAIEEELVRTSASVDALLALAQADAGARTATLEPAWLDDLVADEVPRWQATADAAGISLHTAVLEECPAQLDPALVRRVVGVLLDNALQYTPRGGAVHVSVSTDADGPLLEVEDTGLGIPITDRAEVFSRFFRTSAARAVRPDGSGLGLSLAAWIMAQHGGTIEILDRRDGRAGCRVSARWPRVTRSPETASVPARA